MANFFSVYSFVTPMLYYEKNYIFYIELAKIGNISNIVLSFNLILSLLFIFQTNTAYEELWERRKAWQNLVNAVRDLTCDIWRTTKEREAADRERKKALMPLVVAFAIAMNLHLRYDSINKELGLLISTSKYSKLQHTNYRPLEITFSIKEHL